MVLEGGFDFAVVEEVVSEPYLGHVCLVFIGSVDFLNREELFRQEMKPLPDFTETPSSQLFTLQIPLNKRSILKLILFETGLDITMMCSIVIYHVLTGM